MVEGNTEVIIEMKITSEREVEVGLWKDHFQGTIIIEGMIEGQVIADQDQVQEQVQIRTGLDVISTESMMILQKIVTHPRKKEKWKKSNRCLIYMGVNIIKGISCRQV